MGATQDAAYETQQAETPVAETPAEAPVVTTDHVDIEVIEPAAEPVAEPTVN